MAVVLDSLTATLSRTVFVKPPDEVRQWTAWPRAIVNFNILDGVISAKPVNDQQELIIGMTLDSNLAYKMGDLCISLVQDVANDWNVRGYIEITNGVRNLVAGATQRHAVILDDAFRVPQGGEMWIGRTAAEVNMPRYVIQTTPAGNTPVITFKATNQSAAVGAAGTVNFFVSFFEYEIEQVERFPIHYATQTYSR